MSPEYTDGLEAGLAWGAVAGFLIASLFSYLIEKAAERAVAKQHPRR